MVGDSLISNYATSGYGMAQHLAIKAKLSGLRFPWGRCGKIGLIESVLGILRGRDKILGRLFGKGDLGVKVLNLNQIKKLNLAASN